MVAVPEALRPVLVLAQPLIDRASGLSGLQWFFVISVVLLTLRIIEVIRGPARPQKAGHGKKLKVVVIGGGISGIVAAKELIQEGHDVQIFEKEKFWGGVWKFTGNKGAQRDMAGQVWQDLITTSSAYITCFSDFPPEREFLGETERQRREHPFHLSQPQYYAYQKAFMDKFNVHPSMRLNTVVHKMHKVVNSNGGVQWKLDYSQEGKKGEFTADFVVVATGQHQRSEDTQWPGLSEFKGDVIHSSDYVNSKPWVGKRVLVIGGGDSGGDIVGHVAQVTKPGECYMSLRRGAHVAPRYFHKDFLPIDYSMFRFAYYLPHYLRTNILRGQFRRVLRDVAKKGDQTSAQILRLHHLNGFSATTYFTTKSELMCQAFAEKKAHLKPEVAKFTSNMAYFEKPIKNNIAKVDDSPVEIDSVILCTGFKQWWPFLPDGLESHDHLDRLRHVFHPELPNVGFCGFARPVGFGAIPPLSEIQARWIAQVASGKVALPPRKEFLRRVAATKGEFLSVRKTPNQTLVFYPYFLSEVANEFGACPGMFKILLTDPKLWYNLMWKPFTPHQFRLEGPGAVPELARDMIVNKITMPTTRQGPLARPNKFLLTFLAIFFGMLSKVPVIGAPFATCI